MFPGKSCCFCSGGGGGGSRDMWLQAEPGAFLGLDTGRHVRVCSWTLHVTTYNDLINFKSRREGRKLMDKKMVQHPKHDISAWLT